MKQIKITLFTSTGSPVVDKYRYDVSWSDLCLLLSEHQVLAKKEDAKLISPVSFVDFEAGVQGKYDNGDKYLRRCRDNVKDWYLLPVDIDDMMTIEEAKERFKDYEFILYTSYNHSSKADKFRIFILLSEPVPNDEVFKRGAAIHKFIIGADATSLSRSRQFYLPSCPAENKNLAYTFYNKGKCLDLLAFEATEPLKMERKVEDKVDDDFKTVVLELLGKIGTVDYDTWWKIGSAMQDAGYRYDEFVSVSSLLRSHRPDRDCDGQWRSSEGGEVSFGYLVNILKNELGADCFKTAHKAIKKTNFNSLRQLYLK